MGLGPVPRKHPNFQACLKNQQLSRPCCCLFPCDVSFLTTACRPRFRFFSCNLSVAIISYITGAFVHLSMVISGFDFIFLCWSHLCSFFALIESSLRLEIQCNFFSAYSEQKKKIVPALWGRHVKRLVEQGCAFSKMMVCKLKTVA